MNNILSFTKGIFNNQWILREEKIGRNFWNTPYFWMINTQSYKYIWFFYSEFNMLWRYRVLVHVDGAFQSFFSFFSFHFRAPPSPSFITPLGGYLDEHPVYGGPYIFGRMEWRNILKQLTIGNHAHNKGNYVFILICYQLNVWLTHLLNHESTTKVQSKHQVRFTILNFVYIYF